MTIHDRSEHIEFSMTFDAPVTVTGGPTFAFDLGGASTATYYAGSGTATLRFSHAVTFRSTTYSVKTWTYDAVSTLAYSTKT